MSGDSAEWSPQPWDSSPRLLQPQGHEERAVHSQLPGFLGLRPALEPEKHLMNFQLEAEGPI